jgi:hypothetical protein
MIGMIGAVYLTVTNGGVADRELMERYQRCVARESDANRRVETALDLGRFAEKVVLQNDGRL